ncbi:KR domain-containing protein [Streptomyces sp.]|uniref:KR domain-containing protein n=1 Tax=Streptomyces sp. TaxID=1931 RepID=UPI002D78A7D4|nr:KR domain-containing protein [Streptomyces sp.]HET6355658.1 KR domain-containing protein [Streptomyces sp.]
MSAPRQGSTTLLGAEGARELIAFLTAPAPSRIAVIERAVQEGGPVHRLRLRHPEAAPADGAQEPEATETQSTETEAKEAEAKETAAPARPAEPHLLDRHVLRLAPAPRPARAEAPPPLFPPGTAVLANLDASQLPGDSTVLQDDETIEADVLRARPRHVRVLVDLSAENRDTGPSEQLLRLHEGLFRTAKACAELPERPQSFVVLVLGGIDAARVPHPCSGLFTGFAKSLALEWPDSSVVAVVHEATVLASAEADTAAEAVAEQLLPVVSFAGGTRLLWQAAPEPGESGPQRSGTAAYTVVAAGGGRGIGAELLIALARRERPRLHVIGSTRLDTVTEADVLLTRKDFIRTRTTASGAGRLTVREANAAFDRLSAAREVKANLTALEEICGPGRVTYHACDLRDRAAVDAVVGQITDARGGGRVDLLLNIAGTNRAASVDQKSLGDFRTVRDLKVRTYANLKAAFGSGQPHRWCNFGSFVGFTGQTGETDYGAANDYFNTAALYSSSRGAREFTIGWTLWRDVGLGATPIMRTFLAKSAQFTAMPTAEGIDHFLHELDQAAHTPVTVLFGDPERAAIEAAVPGYLDFCRTQPTPPAPIAPAPALPDFFVDDIVDRGPDRLTVVRTFNQDRDAYLHEHVVNGFPTLPGTFVPELAAQAAMHLVPGRVPVVFEDVRLDSFLRVYKPGRDETKRIKAHLVSHGPQESVVDIEVTGDVLAPGGRLLVKDRRHFSARVRLRDEHVAPPRWDHWDDQGAERMADPYHVPNPAVLLSGVFVSTADTRTHPNGRRARYVPDRPGIERWFSSLVVPSVLLDGLARVSVLDRSEGDWTPLAVPRTIRRIDLYGGHTDASLTAAGTGVELYSLPSRLDLESAEDNRALAVTAAGEVVLQIKDMTGVVLGHVNQSTGEYRERRRPAEEAAA